MPSLLPSEVLHNVFSKLEQRDLFGSVPIVSKQWRAVSSSVAPQKLDARLKNTADAARFAVWLAACGHRQLEQLHMRCSMQLALDLPWSQTAQLRALAAVGGRLTASSLHAGQLTALSSLALGTMKAAEQVLEFVAAITSLKQLLLSDLDWGPLISRERRHSVSRWASRVWPALQQLKKLVVTGCDMDDAAVQGLSTSLSRLKHLQLSNNQLRSAACLRGLPAGLTYLDISHNHQDLDCSEILDTSLSSLQHLAVAGTSVSQSHQLTALQALTHLAASEVCVRDANELIVALGSLQHLKHLDLSSPHGQHVAELQALLQHAPQLTYLDLGYQRLGQAADEQPFMAGCSMPNLRLLRLPALVSQQRGLNGADMQQLVVSCPHLTQLNLLLRVGQCCDAPDLQHLVQLTCLKQLAVSLSLRALANPADHGRSSKLLQVLGQLHSLEDLLVDNCFEVIDVAVLSLTQLQQLTQLRLSGLWGISEAMLPPGRQELQLRSSLKKGKAQPNVWRQLLTLCEKSPACMKVRLQQLEQELTAAKKEIVNERKKAAAALKQAIAVQKAASTSEHKALTAQQEVVELRQQLAALQAGNSPSKQ